MTSREFCYWLMGYFEIQGHGSSMVPVPTADQIMCIRKHLAMVFEHEIDLSYPKEQQAKLNALHGSEPVMRC